MDLRVDRSELVKPAGSNESTSFFENGEEFLIAKAEGDVGNTYSFWTSIL
jgi:hypothetical protein